MKAVVVALFVLFAVAAASTKERSRKGILFPDSAQAPGAVPAATPPAAPGVPGAAQGAAPGAPPAAPGTPPAAPAAAGAPCVTSDTTCDFYNCLETRLKCGPQGYPIGYGFKYCNKFKPLESDPLTASWVKPTRKCLQDFLAGEAAKLPATFVPSAQYCATLKDNAFNSHPDCYVNSGPGICALPVLSKAKIFGVVDPGDLFTVASAKQAAIVAGRCGGKLADWGLQKLEAAGTAVNNFGKSVVSGAGNLLNRALGRPTQFLETKATIRGSRSLRAFQTA